MTDQALTVHPLLDGWWFIAILILFGIYILWQEYKREIRFRTLRLIAAFFVMTSIAALFLRPSFKTEKELSAVLLTDGYRKEQADSLYRTNQDLQFYHLPDAAPYNRSIKLASINDITSLAKEIRLVLGNGLPAYAWNQLDNTNYISGNLPTGLTSINIPDRVYTNREGILQGKYAMTGDNLTIALKSPAGVEDSVTITKPGMHSFKLSFTPRQSGNFVYELIVRQAGKAWAEPVPVIVHPAIPYKTLFLQQQPVFENQYLKSFLSGKNHSIVLRSQLSRSIFRYEYINHPSVQINTLSQKILSGFDLVIVDSETLQSISAAEIKALKDAIDNGLGLLVLMHDQPANSRNVTTFIPWKTVSLKTDTTNIILASGKTASLAVAPFAFTEGISSLQTILQNKRGVLAGFGYAGTGKVGFQLLQNTYPLILQGDTIAYSKLWSPVLEQIARSQSVANAIRIKSTFPIYPHQPVDIELTSAGGTPVLQDDSISLPLAEDARIDNIWHATTWAGNSGWHILATADSVQLPYYVSTNNSWHSLEAANRVNVSQQKSINKKEISDSKYIAYTPVAPLIFFITLLLSLGFLWLAPKL
ncbi:hypothetical protein ACFQ21_05805 [Ohtaekwangia kribbensis]|uniref:ABC-type uncharacterized transport system domain-containing protein n=1 Tax=Ohtaekwangia kribbensis TaxID=688913 RepID=A0ABW3JYL1_9BACT